MMAKAVSESTFELGVNYWPRRSAMQMWKRFDIGECREDLARIAGWGCSAVRFFFLWEDFQPDRDVIDGTMLRNAAAFMDAAHAAGLRCMPTLFTGHMSGANWLPAWALEPAAHPNKFRTIAEGRTVTMAAGDIYRGALLEAQVRFARAAGRALKQHPALFVWDLGNEFSNVRIPDSPRSAAHWSARLTDALLEESGASAIAGIHGDDFFEDRSIRPSTLCERQPLCTMHAYALYAPFARSPLDPEVVPFMGELASSFARKRMLMSEMGFTTHGAAAAPPAGVTESVEAQAAQYAGAVLDRLQRRGSLGAYWWCFADYDDALRNDPPFDRAPHELGFGVIRKDGSEKPVANVIRQFAAERRQVLAVPAPIAGEESFYANLPESLYSAYGSYLRAHVES